MNIRMLKAVAAVCMAGVLLTGCGSAFPEMTQEEYDQIVQYSVSLLMKYSNNGVERLSSVSALEMQRQMEKEAREAAKAERDAQLEAAVANGSENTEQAEDTETDLAMADEQEETTDISPDAEVNPASGDEEDDVSALLEEYGDTLDEGIKNAESSEDSDDPDEASGTEEQTEEPSIDEQLDALESAEEQTGDAETETTEPESGELTTETDMTVEGMRQELSRGLFLTYTGYSVTGSYADEKDVFSITATQGNKLLVLGFKLINTSEMDVTVDMVKANPHFQVLLNGTNVGYTNVTMLDNDLSSFAGTIPAGEKVNMVLIKQMKAEKVKTVDTLGLIGTLGDDTITFNLE